MNKQGILNNKEVFDAWLEGAEVEYQVTPEADWKEVSYPAWAVLGVYRVKPTPGTQNIFDCVDVKTDYLEVVVPSYQTNRVRLEVKEGGESTSIYLDEEGLRNLSVRLATAADELAGQ